MREIKFRAWDKEGKEGMFEIFDSESQKNWFLPSWKKRYEVMQYTGLKDKKGKEIYEGDLVEIKQKFGSKMTFRIQWDEDYWMWHLKDLISDDWGWHGFSPATLEEYTVKVIGNIYENPELLTPPTL